MVFCEVLISLFTNVLKFHTLICWQWCKRLSKGYPQHRFLRISSRDHHSSERWHRDAWTEIILVIEHRWILHWIRNIFVMNRGPQLSKSFTCCVFWSGNEVKRCCSQMQTMVAGTSPQPVRKQRPRQQGIEAKSEWAVLGQNELQITLPARLVLRDGLCRNREVGFHSFAFRWKGVPGRDKETVFACIHRLIGYVIPFNCVTRQTSHHHRWNLTSTTLLKAWYATTSETVFNTDVESSLMTIRTAAANPQSTTELPPTISRVFDSFMCNFDTCMFLHWHGSWPATGILRRGLRTFFVARSLSCPCFRKASEIKCWRTSRGKDRDRRSFLQIRKIVAIKNQRLYQFFKGILGTRFGSLELKIGSLDSEKIIIGSLESEKIGSLQVHTGYLTFSLKKSGFTTNARIVYKCWISFIIRLLQRIVQKLAVVRATLPAARPFQSTLFFFCGKSGTFHSVSIRASSHTPTKYSSEIVNCNQMN